MIETDKTPIISETNRTHDRSGLRYFIAFGTLFGLTAGSAALDVFLNVQDKIGFRHAIVDEVIVVFGLTGMVLMGYRQLKSFRRERELSGKAERLTEQLVETEQVLRAEADELATRLAESEAEATRWKQEAGGLLAGLGVAIDAQFGRWGLSPAEREIGLLLLKGLSHKEIAVVRQVSEATVRQQAQRLYRKANVNSRNDLAAFFLEDLFLPSSRKNGSE